MKVRLCFVANSSSSSFMCNVCGDIESGMDISIEDCSMKYCENGHVICGQEMDIEEESSLCLSVEFYDENRLEGQRFYKEIKDYSDEEQERLSDEGKYYERVIKASACLICNLKYIQDKMLLKYILKELHKEQAEVVIEIQGKFKTLKELEAYCNEN